MPIVTPRPSAFGLSFTKSTAPVSKDGLYGFFAGVLLPGAAYEPEAPFEPFAVSPAGVGSSSSISWRRSMPCTEESFSAALIAASALAVGTVART